MAAVKNAVDRCDRRSPALAAISAKLLDLGADAQARLRRRRSSAVLIRPAALPADFNRAGIDGRAQRAASGFGVGGYFCPPLEDIGWHLQRDRPRTSRVRSRRNACASFAPGFGGLPHHIAPLRQTAQDLRSAEGISCRSPIPLPMRANCGFDRSGKILWR